MATGYQMVLVLKSETVSPTWKPYSRAHAVLNCVALVLTWAQSRLSLVAALMYEANGAWGCRYSGEYSLLSKAHSQVVRCWGTGRVRRGAGVQYLEEGVYL